MDLRAAKITFGTFNMSASRAYKEFLVRYLRNKSIGGFF